MNAISLQRFNLLAGYVRHPGLVLTVEECQWFEAGNERLLGVIARDLTDNDFAYILLGRDRLRRFRAVETNHSFPSQKRAREALRVAFAKNMKKKADFFHQGDEVGEPFDAFRPVVPAADLNPAFRQLSTYGVHPSARIIQEMLHWYEDVDGNFLEQFQTTGFDARLWELYLFALFIELGYTFDREFNAPDYLCVGLIGKLAVEATTVNPSDPPIDLSTITKRDYYNNYVPLKFGSALYSKLTKKYWEKEHLKGLPFVLAIQDFHEWQSMSWSIYALAEYLFGVRGLMTFTPQQEEPDRLLVGIGEYEKGETKIPAGFFFQPDAENVSAVIANPSGTIAKFDRMAFLAGFADKGFHMVRHGLCFRDSDTPEPFTVSVTDGNYSEAWVEGLTVFHNPNALIPLPPDFLPGAGHYFMRDNQVIAELPPFHPIGSVTFAIASKAEIDGVNDKRDLIKSKLERAFKSEE